MSVPSRLVRCHGCDFEGAMLHLPITLRYHLGNGGSVDYHRANGWCHSCNSIRDIEAPINTLELQYKIEQLKPKKTFTGFISLLLGGGKDQKNKLKKLNSLLWVAQNRQSKPRCLECSGVTVSPLKFGNDDRSSNFTHSCGSQLYLVPSSTDDVSFFYNEEIIHLDVEGVKIGNV